MTTAAPFTLTTSRLIIRPAKLEDADLFLRLWIDPRVMTLVGFPHGLPITLEDIRCQIEKGGISEFEQLLVVETRQPCQTIGECRMHSPNAESVASTDVKLLPEY